MTLTIARRAFDVDESIARVREFERRGIEYKVRSGLELLRAKRHLEHGAWYAFLYKAQVYPSTATRRMRIAEQFLEWASIPFVMDGVIEISNPVGGKPCILHDFAAARKVNIDRFWDESSYHGKEYVPNPTGAIIVPRLDSAWKQVDEFIGRQYRKLPTEKKQELKDWLQMQIDRGNAVLQLLEELDQAATAKKSCPRETPERAPRN